MAVDDITLLVIAGMMLGIAIRQSDKFLGNMMIFLSTCGTLLILTGNDALISVLLIIMSLGNLIYGVFTARK